MKIIFAIALFFTCSYGWTKDALPFFVTNDDEIWITSFDRLPHSVTEKIKSAKTTKTDFSSNLEVLKAVKGLNRSTVSIWHDGSVTEAKLGVITLYKHETNATKGDCHNYPNTYISIKLIGDQKKLTGVGFIIPSGMTQRKAIIGSEKKALLNEVLPSLKKMYPQNMDTDMIANPEKTIVDRTSLFKYKKQFFYLVNYRITDGFDVFLKDSAGIKHLGTLDYTPCGS